ncbi:hypothetical protein Zmor_011654 [Zophobas morio]|uniref:Odorant receptor n=1 Tax=Zophobas morio TaxID=2755281 RepID=A0AA38IQF9_9CUCU|nr:hypothetical protein Zmor_011654 [Zophobas morio]
MRITVNDYNLCDSFALEKKLLLLAGFYPNREKKYLRLYYLSAFINLVISYGQLVTMVIQMVLDRSDLLKLTESLLYFFTHFTFICKLLNFQCYFNELKKIEDFLTDPAFYGFSSTQLEIIKIKIRSCDTIANIFRVCCSCTITFYSMVPFIDATRKGALPLPGWFPYDIQKYYSVTFFLQVVSVIISAYGNTGIDILTWKLISIASAQFEILKQNLEEIDFENDFDETKELLVKCINHHLKIVELTKKVQNAFSKGMFLQLFCSIGVICTNGFQMVLVPIASSQFAFSVSYLCGMTCQIATYCWYGHDVMTTSDEIARSLYMSNWYQGDHRIRKMLTIFLENVKKPILIKAGNFVTLSLATLTQILRSAYSYFAVLQRLYNDA